MNCPSCHGILVARNYKGIRVDGCPACKGMWLDVAELDQLEDKVLDEDDMKGTLIFSLSDSNRMCPKCGNQLRKFKYRLYDLELEMCEQQHGYWLDAGEEKRVLELMKSEIKAIKDKDKAEAQWTQLLGTLRHPSFVNKLVYLLRG